MEIQALNETDRPPVQGPPAHIAGVRRATRPVMIGGVRLKGKPYSSKLLHGADAVVITTAHQSFVPEDILRDARLVIDTRNLMRGRTAPHLIRL